MAFTGAETDGLTSSGTALRRVGHDVVGSAGSMSDAASGCAGALSQVLAGALDRYAAAVRAYGDEIGTHVETVGFLATGVASDLEAADGTGGAGSGHGFP